MDTSERLCLFCTEFEWEEGAHDWSEMTPGYSASIHCNKHVWSVHLNDLTTDSFRETMLTAGTCKHYHCIAWDKKNETKTD